MTPEFEEQVLVNAEPVQPERHGIFSKTAQTVGSLLLSTAISVGTLAYTYHVRAERESCHTNPSAQDIATTDHVLAQATTFTKHPRHMHHSYEAQVALETKKADIARQHGLTVFNYTEYMGDLYRNWPKLSFNDLFARAQDFIAQYGVKLELDTKSYQTDTDTEGTDKLSPADKKLLNTADAKWNVVAAVQLFAELPKELVDYIGVKHVVFGYIDKGGAVANPNTAHNTFFVDVRDPDGVTVFQHELYHLLDAKECGSIGMSYDSHFTALNPGNIYHSNHRGYMDDNAFFDRAIKISPQSFGYTKDGKRVQVPASVRNLGLKTVTTSDYGFSNQEEDKAEFGKHLFEPGGDYLEAVDPTTPILAKKFEFLAARLYHVQPQVLKYFADYSHYLLNQ